MFAASPTNATCARSGGRPVPHTLLHRNRVGIAIWVGIAILDGFDELTALVPEIEQIFQEARFSCPYE